MITRSPVLCDEQLSLPVAVNNLGSIPRSLTKISSDLDARTGSAA